MACRRPTRRTAALTALALLGISAPAPITASASSAVYGSGVSVVPGANTPDIQDGTVFAIAQVGTRIIVGGSFTSATNHGSAVILSTPNLLAFDQATGLIDTGFQPAVNGEVDALAPGDGGSVFVGGQFTTVNGLASRVSRLDSATGATMSRWVTPTLNGPTTTLQMARGQLFVGGSFTKAGYGPAAQLPAHLGLAALDPVTGAVTTYVNTQVDGHHSWTATNGVKKGAVGVKSLKVSPDGTQMTILGNFTTVDGTARDQIARLSLGSTGASVDTNWNTAAYTAICSKSFDSYVRDVDYSPDGSYLAVVATGAGGVTPVNTDGTRSKCDTAVRFESSASGTNVIPSWTDYTGNDSFWSVTITDDAVYAGGHQRWVNNSAGSDRPGAGSVPRAGLAAMSPLNGLPLAWNPGRDPRGAGAFALLATSQGLYVGSDTDYIGSRQYFHGKIAFFPAAGGATTPSTGVGSLPGDIYQMGGFGNTAPGAIYRVNVGGPLVTATDGGINWAADLTDPSQVRGPGTTIQPGSLLSVDNTVPVDTPDDVFATQRFGSSLLGPGQAMHYGFPVPAGTGLHVRLFFNESVFVVTGSRVFDVSIDGTPFLSGFDAVAAAGSQVGTERDLAVTSDGEVDVDFTHGVNRPMLSAIEIVKDSDPPTPPSGTPVYRVNAGGSGVPATDGSSSWLPDGVATVTGGTPLRTGGTANTYATPVSFDATVPSTTPSSVFGGEETSASLIHYGFPVPSGARATVRLYWANQSSTTSLPGQRMFNVAVNGNTVLTSFDVVAAAGGTGIATMKTFDVTSSGTVTIDVSKGAKNNPFINAIEIIQTQAAPTVSPDNNADRLTTHHFDGTTPGALGQPVWGSSWHRARGAFVVDNTLFYGWTDGFLHERSLVGSSAGPDQVVDPYNDPIWSKLVTGSTSTTQYYRGLIPSFYLSELQNVTAMFYSAGRIYYTLAGQPAMYSRYFTPDSGAVGSDRFTGNDGIDWSDTSGAFLSGSTLYFATRSDGALHSISWAGGQAAGTSQTVDTSTSWAARAMFLLPDQAPAPQVSYVGSTTFNGATQNPWALVPGAAHAGDTLLLFMTMGATTPIVTTPYGWSVLGSQINGTNGLRTDVFTKVADPSDAGAYVKAVMDTKTQVSLTLAAYSGAAPAAPSYSTAADAFKSVHTTPPVVVAHGGSLVIAYWSDKSNAPTTTWTPSLSVTSRTATFGTVSSAVSSLLADSGSGVVSGGYPGVSATTNSTSLRGNSWSVVLAPAS